MSLIRNLRNLAWKVVSAGAAKDVTVNTWNGRLTFRSDDTIIGKTLYRERAWERELIGQATALLPSLGFSLPCAIGLDIGANLGMISVALVRHGIARSVFAFEPDPDNVRLLRLNVEQNGFVDQITVAPFGLSSDERKLALRRTPGNSGDSQTVEAPADGEATVLVRPLDAVYQELGIEPKSVGIVWLDIQGHECAFFRGAKTFLAHGMPVVSEFSLPSMADAGVSEETYTATVTEVFTHYIDLNDTALTTCPINRIGEAFAHQRKSAEMGEVLFFRR